MFLYSGRMWRGWLGLFGLVNSEDNYMKKKYFGIGVFVFISVILSVAAFYVTRRPMISVVMSTYNRADSFLVPAIESILNQTYKDFEFIIINDGSVDQTANILAKYASNDKRIKVITNNPNEGLIASLNKGLAAAKGKYIARMDDDDVSLPNRFERQIAYLEAHPEITVAGSWVSPPNSMSPYPFQRETDPDRVKIQLYLGIAPVCHPALMIRRDFLKQHDIWYKSDYVSAEDRPFYADILNAGGMIVNMPEVLLQYRLHGTNNYQYYFSQKENVRRFHVNFINHFFLFNKNDDFKKCDLLPRMIEANKTKKIVNQEKLEDMYIKMCDFKADYQIQLKHPFWTDSLLIKEKRVSRVNAVGELGKIVHQTKESLTIKWDKWGQETFVRGKDGVYTLKESK